MRLHHTNLPDPTNIVISVTAKGTSGSYPLPHHGSGYQLHPDLLHAYLSAICCPRRQESGTIGVGCM